MNLAECLEDLERRIDPEIEEQLLSQWREFTLGQWGEAYFVPRRSKACPPGKQWPQLVINQALEDLDRMALHQLAACSQVLADGGGPILNVRTNYGTGIMSSLFGAELFMMEDAQDTLPTTWPLKGGVAAIERIVNAGVPDLTGGWGAKCFEMAQHFKDLLADYPKVARYVHIYHPDLQGPIDICELLWGSDLFVNLVDEPDLVKALLDVVTETYIQFLRRWQEIVPPRPECAIHWGMMHQGTIMLRDDSAMNLSPAMFEEFIEPWDQRLLDEFGGGGIHFCGRGDHYITRVGNMRGVHAVNMSQPECNDLEVIFANTVDKGIRLIGLQRAAAERAVQRGRQLHGYAQCW